MKNILAIILFLAFCSVSFADTTITLKVGASEVSIIVPTAKAKLMVLGAKKINASKSAPIQLKEALQKKLLQFQREGLALLKVTEDEQMTTAASKYDALTEEEKDDLIKD